MKVLTSDQKRPAARRQLQENILEATAPVWERVAEVLDVNVRRNALIYSVLRRHCTFCERMYGRKVKDCRVLAGRRNLHFIVGSMSVPPRVVGPFGPAKC